MCRELGFAIEPDPNDPDICVAKLDLASSHREFTPINQH
jgi:hypothetical protein